MMFTMPANPELPKSSLHSSGMGFLPDSPKTMLMCISVCKVSLAVLFAMIFVTLGLGGMMKPGVLNANGESVGAVIAGYTDYKSRGFSAGDTRYATLKYTVNGKEYTTKAEQPVSESLWSEGYVQEMIYDPNEPARSAVPETLADGVNGFSVMWFLIGLLMLTMIAVSKTFGIREVLGISRLTNSEALEKLGGVFMGKRYARKWKEKFPESALDKAGFHNKQTLGINFGKASFFLIIAAVLCFLTAMVAAPWQACMPGVPCSGVTGEPSLFRTIVGLAGIIGAGILVIISAIFALVSLIKNSGIRWLLAAFIILPCGGLIAVFLGVAYYRLLMGI